MAMRKSTRSELRMLRIVASHYLTREKCFFCKKPLLEGATETEGRWGHPIEIRVTEHHKDTVRDGKWNAPENRVMVHTNCHKRFHARDGK